MHKKFEEFVLAGMGRDSMEKVVEWDCPGDLNLEALGGEDCDNAPCALCWGHAMMQWIEGQPIETTTEAPTEDGFYFARAISRSNPDDISPWAINEYRHKAGLETNHPWGDYLIWERSVDRIQMPGVRDGE